MSTPLETQSSGERSWIYIVVTVAVLTLMVVGLIAFETAKDTQRAEAKADEFIVLAKAAGFDAPAHEDIVRVLGEDGGAVCEDPNSDLSRAVLLAQLTNGASGPGNRPVVFDRRMLAGQLLIMEVYCPEELPSMEEFVDDLKSADLAKED